MAGNLALGLLGLLPLVAGQLLRDLVINPKNDQQSNGGTASSVTIDLSDLFNNKAFGMTPGEANYDGIHSGYPAQYVPDENFTYYGVNYIFPQYRANGSDNMLAQGQVVTPPKGRYSSINLLAAAETSVATGMVEVTYTDNSTTSGSMIVDPFWGAPYPYGGDIVFPYYLTNTTIDYNRSAIFQAISWIDSTKEVATIRLPNVTAGASGGPGGGVEETRLHIFAVSLIAATGSGISLEVQRARSTQLWIEGTNKTQIVEVQVNNVGDEWIFANHSVRVVVQADGLETVVPGVINRLQPGDQAIVQVGVVNAGGTAEGTTGNATVLVTGTGVQAKASFNATFGIKDYDASYESIYQHESPSWFTSGKYGIFIHWGVYAVPGWGNVGNKEQYAEWYWWWMNLGPNGTKGDFYEHHLATYGPNVNYDDFIQNFTTEHFEPKEWVDLFADSGAQYFVQVTKHHEGYALFDIPSNITNRTSVALTPHRNLLQELFTAAETYQPHLHKATYFSLPEWFHPDYAPIGFGSWPGGNATNPYTNKTLPYTGYVHVEDFVKDLILPEMLILADMGSEMLWCDIGGPNLTAEFSAEYFNSAAKNGKQVSINNRCGLPGDFDTPEYARYEAVQLRKWESNLGMDPYSYGYNSATPKSAYITPVEIVTSLVDIVSKNGNFLLDVGPMANGSIVDIEAENLRAAGVWIKDHAEAIFNTTYWFITPEEGDVIRFTQNANAFYIILTGAPNGTVVLDSPVPWVEGDQVTVVGGNMTGTVVPSRQMSNGSLVLDVSEAVGGADKWAWVFKIGFGGVEQETSGNGTYTGAGVRMEGPGWMNMGILMLLGGMWWML